MLKRFTPHLLFLFIFFSFELLWQKAGWFYYAAFLFLAVVLLMFWREIQNVKDSKLASCLAPMLIFLMASLMLALFLEQWWAQRLYAFLIAVITILFYSHLFQRTHLFAQSERLTVDNLLRVINIFTVFLLSAALTAIHIYLSVSFWYLTVLFFVAIFLLSYQFFVEYHGSAKEKGWPLAISVPILLSEFFVIIHFWPVSFYVSALIITSLYYTILEFSRFGEKNLRAIWRTLILVAFMWLIVLTTTAWR